MENNESINNQDNISFIDSHCHLQDYSQEDLDIILNHCSNNNIKVFYSNCICESDFQKNLDISQNQEILKRNDIKKINNIWYRISSLVIKLSFK